MNTEKKDLLTSLELLLEKVNDLNGYVYSHEMGNKLNHLNIQRKILCERLVQLRLLDEEQLYYTTEDTNQNISYASAKVNRKRDLEIYETYFSRGLSGLSSELKSYIDKIRKEV